MSAPDVRGKQVLVYSLGMEGRDLAAWLLAHGARVTMSDTRTEAQLRAAGAVAPDGVERVVSGEALLSPAGFDVLAVSQSVLRHDPAVLAARALGIPVVSQMQLFLDLFPGPVIGITGANGKSTTTALVAAIARSAGLEHVLGGNIGEPLLARVEQFPATTTAILEISHTQLQYTDRSPDIAAITNVTPNHLDQFSWQDYVALKRHILEDQDVTDAAVLNASDEVSMGFRDAVAGRLLLASPRGPIAGDGAWVADGAVWTRAGQDHQQVLPVADIPLRGEHNVANVVMAAAITTAAALPVAAMAEAVRAFAGVPHRLEIVGRALGASWINDSIATSPERAMAGLRAFSEPVVLLLGGREKHLELDTLRDLARARCRAIVTFGEAGPLFAEAMEGIRVVSVASMEDAVAEAAGLVRDGDIVLLSPAGTSFDAYPNFEARGVAFRALVRALPGFEEVAP